MRRRSFVQAAALLPVAGALGYPFWQNVIERAEAQDRPAGDRQGAAPPVPFDAYSVRQLARERAQKPFRAPDQKLPGQLEKLSYDDYRNIRFNGERAVWRGEDLPFQVQLMHRGFLFREKVDIYLVADGQARPLAYSPDLFRFEHGVAAPDPKDAALGFSGFRLHAPMNSPDYFDEVAAFQGASYFRAVAKGQVYGSSARGLSLKTGDPAGEEFPLFVAYWIERPRQGGDSIVLHALLDSQSATAAFRFTIRPGQSTNMAIEMTLFPRVDIDQAGIGTLTSMFFFGPNDRDGVDDFRPMVCDAEALAISNGRGERLWRPLQNPSRLEFSVFVDTNMRGFGLMQRQRSFFDYQDLEARYEKRPSVWVEPIGDWGQGAVHLIEIPTREEIHDNIVAFWRPKDPLRKGGEYSYTYRLHWGWDNPDPTRLARFGTTRTGRVGDSRLFVVDLVGETIAAGDMKALRAEVSTSAGTVRDVVLQPNAEIGGARLSFVLDPPQGEGTAELRAQLMRDAQVVSEVWVYRWRA
ncbi:glucan biosynthesis protein [Aquabacter spiritensis]|uniref:Glucans biosynthesis protein n=1 Tax=Aquabacter spiritensis TaxID=933073 RepID=A0A4R3LSK8_9HYPH|nr:glucan biosynthesis protein G [Aquabacter spiritensis]TCT03480.1 glucans biosynthesis protein [Aquabacter spiritensis]